MAEKKTLADMERQIPGGEAGDLLIDALFDEGSFTQLDKYASGGSQAVTGFGTINGMTAFAFAQDVSVKSGAFSKTCAVKIARLYAKAAQCGAPVIGVYNSMGGDISEGSKLLSAYSEMMRCAASLSGVVPQIAIVTGVCAGTMAAMACMADFVIMTEKAEFFLTPPFVAQDKTPGAGSAKNAAISGAAALTVKDTKEAMKAARHLVSILPANNLEVGGNDDFATTDVADCTGLKGIELIKAVSDKDSTLELYPEFGKAAFVGFGSMEWRTVGFVATNKTNDKLTQDDTAKIARFISFCDAFSIPVVTLVDTEGFENSSGSELSGSVRSAARMIQAYAAATCPKVSVICGNAIGAGCAAFLGKNADYTIALDGCVISPVLPMAAAIMMEGDKTADSQLSEKAEEYAGNEASPFTAMDNGLVDEIVSPDNLPGTLFNALAAMAEKRTAPGRKHINYVY